ncbi:peroxiredoxin Q [Rhizopogon salebrosus TDB-379]|nr:peroxiredoxin Q [Rhizopogon salebrosus TDB-379]
MAPHPLINKPAPEFSIPDANGQMFKFPPEEQGQRVRKPIALFFYPESETFLGTREAVRFRNALAKDDIFKQTGVQVIGISDDPVSKQKQFIESYELTYPVLSDEQHVAQNAFQVGKIFFGLSNSRTTFVIDKDGTIRDSFSSILNYAAHVKFVIKALEQLASEGEQESSTRGADVDAAGPAEQIRDELGRVAYVVGA